MEEGIPWRRNIWSMIICVTKEVVYGWPRAQKWLYLERQLTKSNIIIFPPYLGILSEIHRDISPNLCRDGADIRRDASRKERNMIVASSCRAKEVVETANGFILMEWSWAMTPCELFLRVFSMRCEVMMPRKPSCEPFNVCFSYWLKNTSKFQQNPIRWVQVCVTIECPKQHHICLRVIQTCWSTTYNIQ